MDIPLLYGRRPLQGLFQKDAPALHFFDPPGL
ncbi:hypothetical protein ACP_3034 [Acidobacterium capsulatum ATCC 51196]|uniref:Uncharacterized protein n=1 Tax=Acidobacterium capsulatum (strain ATCC 51196 / DSM 11244 / BCRC 80197 / JCM 7670 / NBRC 15755 / NCIMB 13165 / 161) TaxID=240015 RepID=C1F4J1_ACIC5|nr:hypothetical protein ACP_3034 [Acidobacterium capsulatum ATCC 51196]